MGRVREHAEKLWSGELSTAQLNPVTMTLGLEALDEELAFVSSFANVVALRTAEGLVLVDAGSVFAAPLIGGSLSAFGASRVHTIVATHGHIDHIGGLAYFDAQAVAQKVALPRVVAHEAMLERFARYRLTAPYNGLINQRQFGVAVAWPTEYRSPDEIYRETLQLEVGGVRLELRHARGETDDATWVYLPHKRALCTGDLFIWATPNCGNPQKAQRYPRQWAEALREMARLEAEVLLPGHGVPIFGAARVRQALSETAALLEQLCAQVLDGINAGATLDELLHAVQPPAELLERPYLRPIYDEPQFIVRNLWRLYAGWYDGNPARLKPPPDAALAAEIAGLAGGAARLAQRARELLDRGELALAAALIEHAALAAPTDRAVRELRAEIYRRRSDTEASLMARGIFAAAATR